MILACLLHRVARAYHSALGHGTERAYLTACAACLLLVWSATQRTCFVQLVWHVFYCDISIH